MRTNWKPICTTDRFIYNPTAWVNADSLETGYDVAIDWLLLQSRYNKPSMPIHDGKTSAMENSYILLGEIPINKNKKRQYKI